MARSHGHIAVAAILGALSYALLGELAAFVNTAASSRQLRSRVSLAATKADVEAAKKDFELKKWAAGHLASEGSAQASAAAAKAQQAEAAYLTLKAQLEGQAPPSPVAAAPVAAAPVAAAAPVVAAAPVAGAVSKADLAAVKQSAQLLTWAANKLASEGAPQAAAMKAKADQAVASFEAMKQAQASGAAMPAVAAVPAAPTPMPAVAAAPVAAASVASAVSKEDLATAKQNAQLLTWSYNKLASEGAPQAAAMKVKADQAVAAFEALKQAQASGAMAPAAPAPVAAAAAAAAPAAAPTPVAAAPVSSSAPSAEEVLKVKKEMELHEWAAKSLAASGSLQAAVMKSKAEQSRQTYEALKAAQEQLVPR